MVAQTPQNDDGRPTDELGGELREAVEGILGNRPPEDLMRQTLDALRARRPPVARANKRRLALLAVVAAAACIAVLALVVQSRNDDGRKDEVVPAPLIAKVPAEPTDRPPTLWAYRQASLDSPEALDRLLDEHAARLLPPGSTSLSVRGFPGSSLEIL